MLKEFQVKYSNEDLKKIENFEGEEDMIIKNGLYYNSIAMDTFYINNEEYKVGDFIRVELDNNFKFKGTITNIDLESKVFTFYCEVLGNKGIIGRIIEAHFDNIESIDNEGNSSLLTCIETNGCIIKEYKSKAMAREDGAYMAYKGYIEADLIEEDSKIKIKYRKIKY